MGLRKVCGFEEGICEMRQKEIIITSTLTLTKIRISNKY